MACVAFRERRATTEDGFDAIDFITNGNAGRRFVHGHDLPGEKQPAVPPLSTASIFSVREFEPDRMKVDLRLANTPVMGWLQPNEVKPVVTARHLFGADAADRRVTASMELSPAFAAFPQYADYRFQLPNRLKEGVDEQLEETRTRSRRHRPTAA